MVIMILPILADTSFFEDFCLLFHLDIADKAAIGLCVVLGVLLGLAV